MRTVLFGAFDRHNLGDLLLAMVAEREQRSEVVFAGLAARDMREFGGPPVLALEDAIGGEAVRLIHVGGELLDCDSEQAAYMLGQQSAVATRRQCAYVVAKGDLPAGSTVEFRAVGGVALADRPAAFRAEVLGALRQADVVSVRDAVTGDFLAANGIRAALVPDPVSRIAGLFGEEIRARRPATADFPPPGRPEAEELVPSSAASKRALPCLQEGWGDGQYFAVQFAAEWGDDATLAQLARGLERLGEPVVLFRAGAAPWHDDLEPYRRLAARLKVPATTFESLDIRDVCGLIAGASRVVTTSLHVRIVAEAFGVPAISLEQRLGSARKLRAYLRTWQPNATPVALDEFAEDA